MRVTLARGAGRDMQIRSALGTCRLAAGQPSPPPFTFVGAVLRNLRPAEAAGLQVDIESEFAADLGLGSSAAVTVALQAALDRMLARADDADALITRCVETIRAVQGVGSGADVAASVSGGVVALNPRRCGRAPGQPAGLDRDLLGQQGEDGGRRRVWSSSAGRRTRAAIGDALRGHRRSRAAGRGRHRARRLGPESATLADLGHGLMQALGVSTARLDAIVRALTACPGIAGAKISGAGLGDCVDRLRHGRDVGGRRAAFAGRDRGGGGSSCMTREQR